MKIYHYIMTKLYYVYGVEVMYHAIIRKQILMQGIPIAKDRPFQIGFTKIIRV